MKRGKEDIGAYLEHFLENVSDLPAELQRNFTLMRELDEKSLDVKRSMEKEHKNFVRGKIKGVDSIKPMVDQAVIKQQQCLNFSDEKVSLAVQTYDLLDQHIRQLDADLKRFEEDLKQDPNYRDKIDPKTSRDGSSQPNKKKRGDANGSSINTDLDLAVDPNEPVYCTCKQVSFGEMVACDNPDCPIEWFHFQCVGLTQLKGNSWFCPECRSRMKSGLLKIP